MIKAIDLFAGAGGLSYGFYLTGEYELVAAAEINENARATYKQNIAKHAEKFEFINNVIGYDFGALNQRKGGEIDVVIGGPPCQGFSNANRQKNHLISMNTTDNGTIIMTNKLSTILTSLEEENWDTIKTDLDYVVDLQKLIEFIREITSNELIGEYEYSVEHGLRFITQSYSVIDYVNAILGNEYIQKGNVFNAEWFGVPQERRRFIVLGIRKDIYDLTGKELDYSEIQKAEAIPTVGDAIADLTDYEVGYDKKQELQPYKKDDDLCEYAVLMRTGSEGVKNHITTKTTEKALDRFRKIKQGKNFHSLDIEDKDTYSKPERTQNTIYLRLDPSKPSGTVVNVRKSMWIHPTLDRAISVREAARLQSFPDSFEFIGTKDSQYQQVGNAVPPLLAKGIAEILLKYLK